MSEKEGRVSEYLVRWTEIHEVGELCIQDVKKSTVHP